MSAKDHYRTLTTVEFWKKNYFGTTEFLNSNLDALRIGARIDRVIFVDSDKIISKTKKNLEYQFELRSTIENFEHFGEKVYSDPTIKNGRYNLRFLLSSGKKELIDTISNAPFAIMTNDSYHRGITMSTKNLGHKRNDPSIDLNLYNSDDKNLKGFISNFDNIIGKSIGITQMKSILSK